MFFREEVGGWSKVSLIFTARSERQRKGMGRTLRRLTATTDL